MSIRRLAGTILWTISLTAIASTVGHTQTQESETAQGNIPRDWFLKDPEADHYQGVSVERVYGTLLKGRPSRTVLVAVIDSGIDVDHEDLKDIIWTNEDEIPGNGIDDDKNGYVDDVHGWNFIGGSDGTNVVQDTYELTRQFVLLKEMYGTKSPEEISKKDKAEYEKWLKVKKEFEEKSKESEELYDPYLNFYTNIVAANDTLKAIYGIPKITKTTIDTMKASTPLLSFCKGAINLIFVNFGDVDVDETLDQLKASVDHLQYEVEYGYNVDFDPRPIVGDNYSDPYQKNYGNNDVMGPDAHHGTHVAGIIGANRTNDIGIKGIADNVKIMAIRAVPEGDERDKDIANAILYAVDNGARIINMSFGKEYSPYKEAVDKAVKYAESKGVLIVHAAGNESENIDKSANFPTRIYKDGKEARAWLEVGASSWGSDEDFVASFSNYGKNRVDLFSPGERIYSTVPGNKYKNLDGTSMAGPAAAGVAAILMSYFPELTAVQVRDILRQSSRKFDDLKVSQPGSKKIVHFSELSISGGLVNSYEAVKLALSMQGKSVEK